MNPALPPWLDAWRSVMNAQVIETHISWLLIAANEVFKVKKPLRLPFLDYGSVARRRFCCEEEVRLNRRFAPDLYLGVIPIPDSDEFAVRMRRFPEENRLDHLCARGELTPTQIGELAKLIARFHHQANVAAASSRFGEPQGIIDPARDNFADLRAQLQDIPAIPDIHNFPDALEKLEALENWTERAFSLLQPRFAERKRDGFIRECHGDLHLGNLVLQEGIVMPFDCIEFNEDLRWIDLASEIAFPYIDLMHHQQAGLAAWWINECLAETGDYAAAHLIRFYAVYRALVRAKVAGLNAQVEDQKSYIQLAASLSAPPKPSLCITFGLSGSGKSRASRQRVLSDLTANTLRLRSDVERKRLHGYASSDHSASATGEGIYTAAASTATQDRLATLAADILGAGWSVIVDATFLRQADRLRFQKLAGALQIDYFILAREAPAEVLRARVQRRMTKGKDASEATLDVLENQLRIVEPLSDEERRRVLPSAQD